MCNSKNSHNFLAGDRVVCINAENSVCLKEGREYIIKSVLAGGAIKLDINSSEYNHSRFKRAEPQPVEVKTRINEVDILIDLFMEGGVVICNHIENMANHLEFGKRYIIESMTASRIKLVGVAGHFNKDRFTVDATNNPVEEKHGVPLEWLVEFRSMNGSHLNDIIVCEKIYWCVQGQDWVCKKKDHEGWIKYVRGAWMSFLHFKNQQNPSVV